MMKKAGVPANVDMTLADVIRDAEIDNTTLDKKTAFIKAKLDAMDEEQLTRFEFFFKSHFRRGRVKEVMVNATRSTTHIITDDMAIVVGSLTKLFVGELVDKAMEVLREEDESYQGGLLPHHVEEAVRRMQREGIIGRTNENDFSFSGNHLRSGRSDDSFFALGNKRKSLDIDEEM